MIKEDFHLYNRKLAPFILSCVMNYENFPLCCFAKILFVVDHNRRLASFPRYTNEILLERFPVTHFH